MPRLILLVFVVCLGTAFGQVTSTADSGGYKGPAVLDTIGYPIGRYIGQPITFKWHVNANGNYSTDLTPATTDEDGDLQSRSTAGVAARAGVSGVRHGKDNTTSADLNVGYRFYTNKTAQRDDGADVGFRFNHSRQLDFRTAMGVSAQVRSFGYSWMGVYTPTQDIPIIGVADPAGDGFDSRTTSVGLTAGLTRNLSRRWNANLHSSLYTTTRRSQDLLDSKGWSAGGRLNYSINDKTTTGVGYRFSNFISPDGFGDSWTHSVYASISRKISRKWTASGKAGIYYSQFDRLVEVPLNPLLAAIVGEQTTLEPFYQESWGPNLAATVSRGFRNSSMSVYYRRGIRPGTAFYASSEKDSLGANYSYTGVSRLNLGVGANYNHATTPGDFSHNYYGVFFGANYLLGHGFSATCTASYYSQNVTNNTFNRNRLHFSVGITYSSGSTPVSLF